GPAHGRRRKADPRAAPSGRRRQYAGRGRAQPGYMGRGGLADRHGAGGRRRRRKDRCGRHACRSRRPGRDPYGACAGGVHGWTREAMSRTSAKRSGFTSKECVRAVIDWSTCPAVERDPERVSGAWVFRGTRVPVAALFENLEDGALVTDFVEWFPGATIEKARAVLE